MKYEFDVEDISQISDGYHTFDELYYHRMILFSVICNTYRNKAWKSWKHHDGTMYDDYFIVGVTTPEGDYTYHYHKDFWSMFNVKEIDNAPLWDGHKPSDIGRLSSLLKLNEVVQVSYMNGYKTRGFWSHIGTYNDESQLREALVSMFERGLYEYDGKSYHKVKDNKTELNNILENIRKDSISQVSDSCDRINLKKVFLNDIEHV